MSELRDSDSSESEQNTRVKVNMPKPRKKTAGITLPQDLIEKARKHKLNISARATSDDTSMVSTSVHTSF